MINDQITSFCKLTTLRRSYAKKIISRKERRVVETSFRVHLLT